MSSFTTEKFIPVAGELSAVARDLERHFGQQGFTVMVTQEAEGAWAVSISQGAAVKAALGLKTALNVTLTPRVDGTQVKAAAGVFKRQAVPTALTVLVAWPVVLSQAWGLLRQAGLDDEAVAVAERALKRRAGTAERMPANGGAPSEVSQRVPLDQVKAFCAGCGGALRSEAAFCPSCGRKVAE